MIDSHVELSGQLGKSGDREVFVGFASSKLLCAISVADVLDESTGLGYQRPINQKHSLDFRKYIQSEQSTTIPLTLNLRPSDDDSWQVVRGNGAEIDKILINSDSERLLYQVDCQHRLGYLEDVDIMLPFMIYLGLEQKEEMAVFNIINGKSKGLSSSLLDYHEAQLFEGIEKEKPELVLSIRLADDPESPWFKQLDIGGKQTSGVKRRASLRTMQKAVRRFIRDSQIMKRESPDEVYEVVKGFWVAVAQVLEEEWNDPRKHMINKGVGVYSLMSIASDLYKERGDLRPKTWSSYFAAKLSDFAGLFDWTSGGPLKGLGGQAGVSEAISLIRNIRRNSVVKEIALG